MAAGDDPRPKQTGRRPSAKAPVTIDLSAERVDLAALARAEAARRPTAVPAEPPPQPAPAAAPRPAAPQQPTPRPPDPPPAAAAPRRRGPGLFGVLLGAIIGGAVVFGIGWLLIRYDVIALSAPDDGTAATALAETQRLSAELESLRTALAANAPPNLAPLENRLAALETATAGLPALRTDLAGAATDTATTIAAIDRLTQEIAGIEQRMLTTAAAGGDPAAAATLTAGLATLEQRIGALERAGPSSTVTALQRRVDDLARQMVEFATAANAMTTDIAGRDRTEAAARSLAMAGLEAAADRGEPFVAQIAALAELDVAPAALAALDPFAMTVPPTVAALAGAFPDVANDVLAATATTNPDAGFWERLFGNARTVVTVRPTEPIAGTTPAAILSRMEAAVEAADLGTALAERQALPEAGLTASADWAAEAERRVALDAAVDTLVEAVRQAQVATPSP